MLCGARLLAALPGTALCCRSREPFVQRCRPARESVYGGRAWPSRARLRTPWEAAVGSFREVSTSARSARFLALCVSRARREELATPSSTGDGGTGGSSLGLGDDGATAALEGRPVGWLPFRGATSRAGRTGCCAVLRVLVAGERCRGRPGRGWGSVGGLVTSQGQCGLPAFASGASFWSWYPWMGCLLLARPKFWVLAQFAPPAHR